MGVFPDRISRDVREMPFIHFCQNWAGMPEKTAWETVRIDENDQKGLTFLRKVHYNNDT